MNLIDSSGLVEHKPIRQNMYKTADVVVFCFSLAEVPVHSAANRKASIHNNAVSAAEQTTSSTISLGSIRQKWLPEVLEVITDKAAELEENNSGSKAASAPG